MSSVYRYVMIAVFGVVKGSMYYIMWKIQVSECCEGET